MTKILALDLGTKCGFALGAKGARPTSGTWELMTSKQRRFESSGMKWVRLHKLLDESAAGFGKTDLVVIEEVRRHAGTDAAHAYGGALAKVSEWCELHGVPMTAVPVATIKKFATEKGNAKKDAMIASAKALGFDPRDDNEADAIHLWRYSAENL